jgi:hypothetical protein
MEAKHTPGPWIAGVDVDAGRRPLGYDTDDVYAADGSRVCQMTGNVARSYHDARLIAAAPEMLAMLHGVKHPVRRWRRSMELCVPDSAGHQNMVEVERELLALIARIEGGEAEGGAK